MASIKLLKGLKELCDCCKSELARRSFVHSFIQTSFIVHDFILWVLTGCLASISYFTLQLREGAWKFN